MHARLRTAMFLSLLDLVSCALGAAILLAVIFSIIEKPIASPKSEDFLAAEFRADAAVQLGVVLYHQQTNQYVLLTPNENLRSRSVQKLVDNGMADGVEWYSVPNAPGASVKKSGFQGMFAFVLKNPTKGDWFVTPYIYSYEDSFVPEEISTIQSRWATKFSGRETCPEKFKDGFAAQNSPSPRLIPLTAHTDDVALAENKCQGKSAFIVSI